MKMRTDFVSNSSTTIFTIRMDGNRVTPDKVLAKLAELREFYHRMTSGKDALSPSKMAEAESWGSLSTWPVKAYTRYDEYVDALERAKEKRRWMDEHPGMSEDEMPLSLRLIDDGVLDESYTDVELAEMKRQMFVEVAINYIHIVDYLRTFLVNCFDAEEDEIG